MQPPLAFHRRRPWLVAVVLLLTGMPASARTATEDCILVASVDDRCESWVSTWDGPDGEHHDDDRATSLAVSPDGSRLYVVGSSEGPRRHDIVTIAYDAASGSPQWTARYDGPSGDADLAYDVALSGDGGTLVVTGSQGGESAEMVTIAYDAATGAERWAATHARPDSRVEGLHVATTADGALVAVAGMIVPAGPDLDWITVLYDGVTGEELWAERLAGADASFDLPVGVAIHPDGSTVLVGGTATTEPAARPDLTVVAYDVAPDPVAGAPRWIGRFDNGASYELAFAMALSDDGSRVYVAGSSTVPGAGSSTTEYMATAGFDAHTGARTWAGLERLDMGGFHSAISVTASRDGTAVYVTGVAADALDDWDHLTVGYDAATGARRWSSRYGFPGSTHEVPQAVSTSPDGSSVFVTGFSSNSFGADVVTVHLDAENGDTRWVARFNSSALGLDIAIPSAIGRSPDGARVYVAGRAQPHLDTEDPVGGTGLGTDYLTIAYDA